MTKFTQCINRNACNEDGTHCRACGRSHEEIQATRELTSQVAEFVKRMAYENPQDFLAYLQRKVEKKIK
ncbi:MAG: hypothetical protein PVF75_04665 [Granulosicoccaceae bacterium]